VTLRRRLTAALACVLGASLAAFSLVLDTAFRRALWAQFDARLAEDARAVASMVEEHGDGRWEFESGPLLGFEAGQSTAYYEAWTDGGRVIGRSPSLGPRDLRPASRGPEVERGDVVLPDGGRGRLLLAVLLPRREVGDPPAPLRHVTVAVGRATQDVDGAIARLRLLLWGSGLSALVLSLLAGAIAVRRGLGPLGRLSGQIDAIDDRRLAERLPTGGLPEELRPVVEKVNGLLSRLEDSFERERRWAADASHELRTPLAALRSILEVALTRPRSEPAYRAALAEAAGVARQLSSLVDGLLVLARLESGQDPPALESVGLRELVDECLAPHAPRARARRLSLANSVPPGAQVVSDRERLRIVIHNLIGNAVEYTAEGGDVRVASDAACGVLLEVSDSGPMLPPEALETVFDRFYRLDSSRAAAGEHWGIGLALVRALCASLKLSVTAENRPDGWLAFHLRGAG
jgi:two-component system sensor histidine kinase QseC